MKYRIMYCDECGREYKNYFAKYGKKCDYCKTKLSTAWKVEEKEYSCVKLIEKVKDN